MAIFVAIVWCAEAVLLLLLLRCVIRCPLWRSLCLLLFSLLFDPSLASSGGAQLLRTG